MGNTCRQGEEWRSAFAVHSLSEVMAKGEPIVSNTKEQTHLSTNPYAQRNPNQSRSYLKVSRKWRTLSGQMMSRTDECTFQDLFPKIVGHIVIRERQTREKRKIISGIGVLVDGNKVLTPQASIISKFNGRRYGNQQIFFKPLSHFEAQVKVKDIFHPNQKREMPVKCCIIELEGQFWPEEFIAKDFYDVENAENRKLYRINWANTTESNQNLYKIEKALNIVKFNQSLAYETSFEDHQLSPVFSRADKIELIGFQTEIEGKRRKITLLTEQMLKLSSNWRMRQPPIIKEYEPSEEQIFQQRSKRMEEPRLFLGDGLELMTVKGVNIVFDLSIKQPFSYLSTYYEKQRKMPLKMAKGNIEIPLERPIRKTINKSNLHLFEKLLKYLNEEEGYFGLDAETSLFASRFVKRQKDPNGVSEYPKLFEYIQILYKKGKKFAEIKQYPSSDQRTLAQIINQWSQTTQNKLEFYVVLDQFDDKIDRKLLNCPIHQLPYDLPKITVQFKEYKQHSSNSQLKNVSF